jgi:glutamate--cysteine ligase
LYRHIEQRLKRLLTANQQNLLLGGQIGLEKESLRVGQDGKIAQTKHPAVLGSALTNPYITTDYSEALIEFITPPFSDLRQSLDFLRDTQKFVYANLKDELLWATSMPCVVAGEHSIPIADYGRSNVGLMKTVYRRGLGYRYGKTMQVIAGVHFNYSVPEQFWPFYQELEQDNRSLRDFIDDAYFAMIRNMQRLGWLIPFLFGASPAVCKSFLAGAETTMDTFDANTYYEPFATSLRMGDIGYQNKKESEVGIKVCYDDIDAYVACLTQAIETPSPAYEKIGVVVNGEYRQLNANILQIENEYYSSIRPKQIVNGNEKPTHALKRRGVRYVELRSLDVNAFDPLGINEMQSHFLEALMLFCLLQDSPPINRQESLEIDYNQNASAHRGRDPELLLQRNGNSISLKTWALEVCNALLGICEFLDQGKSGRPYSQALAEQLEAVRDPDRTPSARMLAEMRATKESFFQFALRMSQKHERYFATLKMQNEQRQMFEKTAQRSIQEQQGFEATDNTSFDEFLRQYNSQKI